jgi:hypothetical protein
MRRPFSPATAQRMSRFGSFVPTTEVAFSLDHPVGECEKRRRDREAERRSLGVLRARGKAPEAERCQLTVMFADLGDGAPTCRSARDEPPSARLP